MLLDGFTWDQCLLKKYSAGELWFFLLKHRALGNTETFQYQIQNFPNIWSFSRTMRN